MSGILNQLRMMYEKESRTLADHVANLKKEVRWTSVRRSMKYANRRNRKKDVRRTTKTLERPYWGG